MEFKHTINILNEFGKALVEEYKDSLILNDVNASDTLYNSVRYIVDAGDTKFSLSLGLEDYYIYVENGRKAGKWPPITAIERWIEVKPVLPSPDVNGNLPTTKQLAYLISRKIGLEGIAPRPLLKQSIENIWYVFEEFLDEAFTKDIEENINEIMVILMK